MQDKIKFIREKFEVLDVSIQDDSLEKYIKYYEMLIEKNKVIKVYEGNDDETKLVEVEKDHFVRGTPEQIVKYKKAVENHQNKL